MSMMDNDAASDAASINTSVLSLRTTPSMLTISSMATTSATEPPPYSMLDPNTTPAWASRDPRTSSMHSIPPPESSVPASKGKRKLLLIYIHGFMGSETSFQSFPAHVHNLLSLLLAESHTVHTKIYPRYRSRNYLQNATNDFSAWLRPHESPETDVILLGHSMGGLVAAEVVLLREDNPGGGQTLRHKILGTIGFDVPYLGMHPGIVKAGLSSLVHPTPGPKWPTREELFSVQPSDPNYNPAYENDVNLPMRTGWNNFKHFVHKHAKDIISATDELIMSHFEFGGSMADYKGLKARYCKLRLLEEEEEAKRKTVVPEPAEVPRVRFANYYTACTGKPKVPSQSGQATPTSQSYFATGEQRSGVTSVGSPSVGSSTLTPASSQMEEDISGESDISELTDLDLDLGENVPSEAAPAYSTSIPAQSAGWTHDVSPAVVLPPNAPPIQRESETTLLSPTDESIPRIIASSDAAIPTTPQPSTTTSSQATDPTSSNPAPVFEPLTTASEYSNSYKFEKQIKNHKIAFAKALHDLKTQQRVEWDAVRSEIRQFAPTNREELKTFLKNKKAERQALAQRSRDDWENIYKKRHEELEEKKQQHIALANASKAERDRYWAEQKAEKQQAQEAWKEQREEDMQRLRQEWHEQRSMSEADGEQSKADWKAEWNRRKEERKQDWDTRKIERKHAWEERKAQRKAEWERSKADRKMEKLKAREAKHQLKAAEKLERAERKMEKNMTWMYGGGPAQGKHACPRRAMSTVASSITGPSEGSRSSMDSTRSSPGPSSPASTTAAWLPRSDSIPASASTTSSHPPPLPPRSPSTISPDAARPPKDRKFCVLPPKHASGARDPTWVRVFMDGYDEVSAHTGLFFAVGIGEQVQEGTEWGARYATLVGDVAERVETWVHEAAVNSVTEGMGRI